MITRKFTSSPFKLRRSIVPQSENGAYQSGGFDPNSYDSSGEIMTASIEGLSNTIGAALGSMTASDINKLNIGKNERRQKRINNIEDKINKETTRLDSSGKQVEIGTQKSKKLEDKKNRIQERFNKTEKEIEDYKKVQTSNDFLYNQRKYGYGF